MTAPQFRLDVIVQSAALGDVMTFLQLRSDVVVANLSLIQEAKPPPIAPPVKSKQHPRTGKATIKIIAAWIVRIVHTDYKVGDSFHTIELIRRGVAEEHFKRDTMYPAFGELVKTGVLEKVGIGHYRVSSISLSTSPPLVPANAEAE